MSINEYQNKINLLVDKLGQIQYKLSKGEFKFIILQNGLRASILEVKRIGFPDVGKQLSELYKILRGQPSEWNNNIYNCIENYYSQIDIDLSIDETKSIKQILHIGYINRDKVRQPIPKKVLTASGRDFTCQGEVGPPPHPYARGIGEDTLNWLIRACEPSELYDYVNYVRQTLNSIDTELIKNAEEHMTKIDKIAENERLIKERDDRLRKEREDALKKEEEEKILRKEREDALKKEEEQRLQEKAEIQTKNEDEEYTKELFKSSGYKYIYYHELYIRVGVNGYLNYINDLHVSQGRLDIIMDGYVPQYDNTGIDSITHRIDYSKKGKIKLMLLVTFENEMKNHRNYNLKRILKIETYIFLKYCEDKYYKHNLHILSKYETKTDELRQKYRKLYKAGPDCFEADIIATFMTKYYTTEEAYSCFLKAYNYLKNFTV
jgi:hypothetical protein